MRVYLRDRDAENAIVRGSPDRAFAVVSEFGNAVGAQSVVHIDAPDFPALAVHRNDAVRSRGQEGAVVFQLQALIDLNVIPAVHCGFADALAASQCAGILPRAPDICHLDRIPVNGQNLPSHSDTFEDHIPVLIPAHAHNAGDIRRMNDPPLHVVVHEKSFEIGKEGMPLTVTEDVKVTVVGIVLAGRVVSEERNAHVGSVLSGSLHRAKRHGDYPTDMIQKLSHLNVI